ncbi:unnamed protein product [Pneumocystis jirovecii]|uniref:Cytochrome c oxidase assembly protein COX20, mitochondrial n=2 Tax=Pneumocystis jirovecii TaxID=42068 RepID=L0PG70_PNEJI|nr:uncharacterized protein T551_01315 [Pneumocystis jirovecii RU7]KTW31243.1 hypothetical protein T551_01315 [Pneumocystis jirovecii RU7]CCJ31358.1 unnamed protein product [Pneumocystis jirovecii]
MFLNISDILNVHRIPCFQNAILYGIASGVAMSTIRIIFQAPIIKACHSGVATFCGISIVSWEGCRYQRYMKKKNMRVIVDKDSKENPEPSP